MTQTQFVRCEMWDEQNWINMDRNMSLIILIIETRLKRYLYLVWCLWYWQRKKFIRSEKGQWLNFWVWKIKHKRCFCFVNVSYVSPYQQLICVWNFQSGNNIYRISNNSSEKRSSSIYCILADQFQNFLLLSCFEGHTFPSSN